MVLRTCSVAIPIPLRRTARPSFDRLGRHVGNVAVAVAVVLALGAGMLALGPRFLPYQVLPVLTGSMEPAIPTGSLAVVLPVRGEDLVAGDVITFQHPQAARSYVTHRIVAIDGEGAARTLITKGDANALPDAWHVVGTGSGWRYAFAVPLLGGAIVAYEGSTLRFALFALPLVGLALLTLIGIWRPRPRELRPAARAA